MDKILKSAKVGFILTAILSIVLGGVLIVYPQMSTTIICYAFGGILVICALFHVFFYFKYKEENNFVNFNLIIAIITGVIGTWIILKPVMVIMIIPVIFGLVLIIHGIDDIRQAVELKGKFYEFWWIALIVALLNVICAVILFVNPFKVVTTLVIVIGISLIYDGVSDLWIISRISKATKEIKQSLDVINKE
ncbi:MAG: HdeD family acid-resistance protein [Lachnotalea sp.]